jgi:hypothetical protein
LIVLLLIAATAAALLLKATAASALQPSHGHSAGQSAHKILHVSAADETFAPAADRKSLGRVGQAHAGKSALTGGAATTEVALQAADTATGRSVAEHAATPAACAR